MRILAFFSKNSVYQDSETDPFFDIAKKKVSDLTLKINGQSTPHNLILDSWCKIVPESENSPWVLQKDGKHIIFFPKNSEPYKHEAINFEKYCQVKSGTILEKLSGKIFNEGDKFTIPENTPVCPVSVNGEAFVIVEHKTKLK